MCSSEPSTHTGSAAAGSFAHPMMLEASARSRSRSPRACSLSLQSQDVTETPAQVEERATKKVKSNFSAEMTARLQKLVDDGTTVKDEFDLKALANLQSLPIGIQVQVMDHLDSDRVFLMNSRSKSGFLMAACEKARTGSLDARGMFMHDPWKAHLLSMARPKLASIDLVPESEWIAQHGHEPARFVIDVSADKDLGTSSVTFAVNLEYTPQTIKKRLAVIGVKMPINKMRLKAPGVGFLKDTNTLAFYNLQSGAELQLVPKTRAGVALKRDQSDGFNPHFCTGVRPGGPEI